MKITETGFSGVYLLEPHVHEDIRGYFMESYNLRTLSELLGDEIRFVQDNQSRSVKGVLRGLHFQVPPMAQTKVIRVLQGEIIDIIVDLRRKEPTFGKVFTETLTSENRKQLLIPKGFAHGFAVVSATADIFYKCDEYYSPGHDAGLNAMDPALGLKRLLPEGPFTMSEKDRTLPRWDELTDIFAT